MRSDRVFPESQDFAETNVPSGGNRSPSEAATQEILASLIHTARLRGLDVRAVLVDLLRAGRPIVLPAVTVGAAVDY